MRRTRRPALALALTLLWAAPAAAQLEGLLTAPERTDWIETTRYAEAVAYYGGDYQVLRGWNPTVPPNDHATLFQKGCTVNGLQCFAIRAVVDERRVSEGEYRFTVKLAADRSVGKLPGEPFAYTVRKVGDQYLVQELPPYIP